MDKWKKSDSAKLDTWFYMLVEGEGKGRVWLLTWVIKPKIREGTSWDMRDDKFSLGHVKIKMSMTELNIWMWD